MNNLTVFFTSDSNQRLIQECLLTGSELPITDWRDRPAIEIPVHYGGESGPDLVEVARHTNLHPHQVVEQHAAGDYHVYFIGFVPGFAYLGGLPPTLATPRRTPRARVPAGSVAIGGQQTGIYPLASPGGWNLIGRTRFSLYDLTLQNPSRLQAGDRIRFRIETLEDL